MLPWHKRLINIIVGVAVPKIRWLLKRNFCQKSRSKPFTMDTKTLFLLQTKLLEFFFFKSIIKRFQVFTTLKKCKMLQKLQVKFWVFLTSSKTILYYTLYFLTRRYDANFYCLYKAIKSHSIAHHISYIFN